LPEYDQFSWQFHVINCLKLGHWAIVPKVKYVTLKKLKLNKQMKNKKVFTANFGLN